MPRSCCSGRSPSGSRRRQVEGVRRAVNSGAARRRRAVRADAAPRRVPPPPKVWSQVIRLVFRPSPAAVKDRGLFEVVVRSLFAQRRKTILNTLRPLAHSREHDRWRDPGGRPGSRSRPETLHLAELAGLADALGAHPGFCGIVRVSPRSWSCLYSGYPQPDRPRPGRRPRFVLPGRIVWRSGARRDAPVRCRRVTARGLSGVPRTHHRGSLPHARVASWGA